MEDRIVCTCLGVSESTIIQAIQNGAHTLEEIEEATQAGTICGACLDDIQEILDRCLSTMQDQ